MTQAHAVEMEERIPQTAKEQIRGLLKELRGGPWDEEARTRAKTLVESMDAAALGSLERELVAEGEPQDALRKALRDAHLEVLRDNMASRHIPVAAPHPVHTLMAEHALILHALANLAGVVNRLPGCDRFEDMGEDWPRLRKAAHVLVEADRHHDREERCLFPLLEKHGVKDPAAVMKREHAVLRARKKDLFKAVSHPLQFGFESFKARITELGGAMTRELENHIFKEDNVLYQIALQTLTEEEWAEVKRGCDRIGYCCFTPGRPDSP